MTNPAYLCTEPKRNINMHLQKDTFPVLGMS